MVPHNLRIAWKSLRRNPTLSMLIVSGIALGIALSTTFATVRHSFAKDPIPQKSGVLYNVRLDSWDPARPHPNPAAIPPQITYRDARELLKSTIPVRQSAMYKSQMYVFPDPKVGRPSQELVRLCFADFFTMFAVPFRYGGPWGKDTDQKAEQVVVLSEEMNEKLFGGRDSVGKTVRIEDKDFRVVGVLDHWMPSIKFYDLTQNFVGAPEPLFIPFNLAEPLTVRTSGNTDGWGPSPSTPGPQGFLQSESVWLQYWVELPDGKARAAYHDYLLSYIATQKKMGRFPRPPRAEVSSVGELMTDQKVVPDAVNALVVVALLFLAVCALNLVGLLLGKFLARAPEVGVRRALGATRLDIFLQHVVECELIGVVGGLIGMGLSLLSLSALNTWLMLQTNRADFFQLDLTMVLTAIGLSLAAGFIAGVYPAWRTCHIPPAIHLKVQ